MIFRDLYESLTNKRLSGKDVIDVHDTSLAGVRSIPVAVIKNAREIMEENIVNESFDKAHPWEPQQLSSDYELYYVEIFDGVEMSVIIEKNRLHDLPEVSFMSTDYNPDDIFAMTGTFAKYNINPIRVFTSIIGIMKQSRLIKRNGGFYMHSKGSEASRTSLYKRMLQKFGLKFTMTNEIKNGYTTFEVRL